MNLTIKHCVPCRGGIPPLTKKEFSPLLKQLKLQWQVEGDKKITYQFTLKNFKEAIHFINEVANIAEAEGHHPDIHLTGWNQVQIVLYTHKIHGLHENDFILASKIEAIPIEES